MKSNQKEYFHSLQSQIRAQKQHGKQETAANLRKSTFVFNPYVLDSEQHSSGLRRWKIPAVDPLRHEDLSLHQDSEHKKQLVAAEVLELSPRAVDKVWDYIQLLKSGKRSPSHSPVKFVPKPVIHKHKRPFSGKETGSPARGLLIKLLSNWGDRFSIGLTEIQFFSKSSEKIHINASDVTVKNSLCDVRPLFNNVVYTNDTDDMWEDTLPTEPFEIVINSAEAEETAGIRIWNYNKSVAETSKGAKELEVLKRGTVVWTGTVAQANGNKLADNFTELEIVNGFKFPAVTSEGEVIEEEIPQVPAWLLKRPVATQKKVPQSKIASLELFNLTNKSRIHAAKRELPSSPVPAPESSLFPIPLLPSGQVLSINILSTWGDVHYVGLSGLELFDSSGVPVCFDSHKDSITAEPADINVLPDYGTDPRTVDKLLDGTHLTCDDLHV